MEILSWVLWAAVCALILVIVVYVAVRVGSIAHYRTRAEYFDRIYRKLGINNGGHDAKQK